MLREMMATQRKVRVLLFRINGQTVAGGSLTRTGILEGTYDAKITENSAGNYTLTYDKAFNRVPLIFMQSATDALTMNLVDTSVGSCQVEQTSADQTTPVADGSFHLMAVGFDATDAT